MSAAATLQFTDPIDLAAALRKKYAGGIMNICEWARWQSDDVKQQSWVAAFEALEKFNPARGELMPRAWWLFRKAAVKSGLVPRSQRRSGGDAKDNGMDELEKVQGGDDPCEILSATQRLTRLGFDRYVEQAGSKRTVRRNAAKARGAAEKLLRGGDGVQGDPAASAASN